MPASRDPTSELAEALNANPGDYNTLLAEVPHVSLGQPIPRDQLKPVLMSLDAAQSVISWRITSPLRAIVAGESARKNIEFTPDRSLLFQAGYSGLKVERVIRVQTAVSSALAPTVDAFFNNYDGDCKGIVTRYGELLIARGLSRAEPGVTMSSDRFTIARQRTLQGLRTGIDVPMACVMLADSVSLQLCNGNDECADLLTGVRPDLRRLVRRLANLPGGWHTAVISALARRPGRRPISRILPSEVSVSRFGTNGPWQLTYGPLLGRSAYDSPTTQPIRTLPSGKRLQGRCPATRLDADEALFDAVWEAARKTIWRDLNVRDTAEQERTAWFAQHGGAPLREPLTGPTL